MTADACARYFVCVRSCVCARILIDYNSRGCYTAGRGGTEAHFQLCLKWLSLFFFPEQVLLLLSPAFPDSVIGPRPNLRRQFHSPTFRNQEKMYVPLTIFESANLHKCDLFIKQSEKVFGGRGGGWGVIAKLTWNDSKKFMPPVRVAFSLMSNWIRWLFKVETRAIERD